MPDLRDPALDAAEVIAALGLQPHPEGGHFRETWRDAAPDGGRGAGTAILFLLRGGEASHWHRVDASELWLWQAGAPLHLRLSHDARRVDLLRLGPNLAGGEALQGVVPPGSWQAAASLGAWTLVTCTVAPDFHFAGFTLAPPGWEPGEEAR
ncbi:MAG: cupin domain-containing protein [Rhodospirillales bacterium]|nr:cupin domain-containing protein [Rhodospirillales bacterium]